jgi:hypothetical protein
VLVDTARHPDPRAAVEVVLGPLASFGSPGGPKVDTVPDADTTHGEHVMIEVVDLVPPFFDLRSMAADPVSVDPILAEVLYRNADPSGLWPNITPVRIGAVTDVLTVVASRETLLVFASGQVIRMPAHKFPVTSH